MWLTHTALALVVASACNGGSQATPTVQRDAGGDMSTAPSALTIDVATDQPTVGPTGRLQIRVTITNTSRTTASLAFTTGCQTDYEILDASGAVIGSSLQMCTEALTQRNLAAGASFTDTHVWIRSMAGQPKLPAGTVIRLRGILLTQGAAARSRNTVTVTLE